MFFLAFSIGILSYVLFAIGLIGYFYKWTILIVGILYILVLVYLNRFSIIKMKLMINNFIDNLTLNQKLLMYVIILQVCINLIGVLGPEFGFDALWYHLTLPKLYLIQHRIFHISGGLLYYSDFPKLTEMLYSFGLVLGGETVAKLIHFSFGILSCIAIYKVSRKFFSTELSFLAVIIFYSNLVVGWMSITAYIDLARTFFELLSLWAFLNWIENQGSKWLITSAGLLGLAISTKLLSIGSVIIFFPLILYTTLKKEKNVRKAFIHGVVYLFTCLLIPLPWFIFSFWNTGNPVYPFFTKVYPVSTETSIINPLKIIEDIYTIFLKSPDPLNQSYIVFLPLSLFLYKKFKQELKIITIYSFLAILVWYITPRSGGGRFILPFLPAFSILSVAVLHSINNQAVKRLLTLLVIFFALISIAYRLGANMKYLPVILGFEPKVEFLSKHLNFSYGDFYDTDGYLKRTIKSSDKVLLYGFHNLYYVDFPSIDSSWVKKGDVFNYIAVQNSSLPGRFHYLSELYSNSLTHVKLYTIGGQWLTY